MIFIVELGFNPREDELNFNKTFSENNFRNYEAKMNNLIKQNQPIVSEEDRDEKNKLCIYSGSSKKICFKE